MKQDVTASDMLEALNRDGRVALYINFDTITIAVSIFIAEVLVMIVVYFLPPLPYSLVVLMDAGIMLVMIFPFLYFFSFLSQIQHIELRRQAENKLRKGYEELEIRIQARTQELRYANLELEAEIIERKQAEQIIKENEEKYRSLFNSMTEGFALHEILCDDVGVPRDYRFLEINPSFERITGFKRNTLLGRTIREVLPAIEDFWIDRYGKVALTRQSIHFEEYTAALGRWYETYCYSPRENQFAVLFFDVTERKQTESQLQYQATLLSNVNDAIIASDAEYHLTAWNAAAETLYGWKAEEVLGQNGLEITRTTWPGIDPDKMRQTITETGRWRGEATQVRRDGTRFPVEVSSITLYNAEGKIQGYVSVNRDITDRELAEKALRQSQLNLSRAQEVGPIGSWRLDVWKNELTWSEENHRIFGIPVGTALTYETFLSTVHPEDRDYVDMKWSVALQGEPYDIEHRIVVSGSTKWVREKAYLEFDAENVLLGGFGITQDITERKKAGQALLESESKYRNLFENMTEEVHFWQLVRDEKGGILTWRLVDANPPTLKSSGQGSIDEIRGTRGKVAPYHVGNVRLLRFGRLLLLAISWPLGLYLLLGGVEPFSGRLPSLRWYLVAPGQPAGILRRASPALPRRVAPPAVSARRVPADPASR